MQYSYIKGGTDAFSTGGAYDKLIVDFEESFSEDGNSKTYQPVNADRKAIGSPSLYPSEVEVVA